MKQWMRAAAAVLVLTVLAAPVMAKGGARGGARISRPPSVTRQAPARPAEANSAARTGQKQNTDAGAAEKNSRIDQGIDPSDYGKRNAGKSAGAAVAFGAAAASGTQSNFTGGGSFFNGFSIWPWLWFAGHGSSSAEGEAAAEEPAAQQEESFTEMIARWWADLTGFFASVFGR